MPKRKPVIKSKKAYWSHLEEEENVIEEELDNFYEAGILKIGIEVDFGPP